MSKRKTLLLMLRIFSDLLAVAGAWVLAYFIRFHTIFDVPKGIPHTFLYVKLIPFILVIWGGAFAASGFYRRSVGKRSAFLEALDVLHSSAFATLCFIAFTYFYEEYRYSRLGLFIFAFMHPWLIIAGRSAIRKSLRYYRRQRPPREVLIIGSGDILKEAIQLPRSMEFDHAKITGMIIVGHKDQEEVAEELSRRYGIPILATPESWPDFFSTRSVQIVIFALPQSAYAYLEANIGDVTDQVSDVKIIPDLLKYSKLGAGIDMVQGTPVINIHESPLEGMGSVIKRVLDVVGASVALVLFSPIMAIIALLVRLSSAGPIFYKQERMGLDGKTFNCLKFRSMPVDAEKGSGPVWAKAGEGRATGVGKFLRKYSLDELPQFFNVLKGEMSLVGPRPERPIFVSQFRTKVPGYMLRHKVKAGVTGWAQVNGWRGNTSIEKRIEYDLYYIQNWSLWLDLRILSMTALEVFFSKNAY